MPCGPPSPRTRTPPDGHWHGWFTVHVRSSALRPLGLHPDQPTSKATGPSPPGWWHAAAERRRG
ncbi:hypothetical protein AB0H77_30525 [Streptomyces sp. NPDC050844]|uniref:hypothetical protein n=1 Tax=Streptomyces sp. NPDC050844 TaxID=3155790 RepID=UPI0033C62803